MIAMALVLALQATSIDVPLNFDLRDVKPAKGDCVGPLSGGEIVVCARRFEKSPRLGAQLPPPPTTMDDINRALVLRIGPIELRPSGLGLKF
jgi:hypothetical protein